jgi:hypothetical protein
MIHREKWNYMSQRNITKDQKKEKMKKSMSRMGKKDGKERKAL